MVEEAIKRLEDIALEVAYNREIVTNLLLCPEHVSHKAEATASLCHVLPSSSFISLNVTSKSIIKFVKDRIDHKLFGTMSDATHRKLIEIYLEDMERIHYGKSNISEEKPNVWVFLDCLLDETFTDLDLHILPSNLLGKGHKL